MVARRRRRRCATTDLLAGARPLAAECTTVKWLCVRLGDGAGAPLARVVMEEGRHLEGSQGLEAIYGGRDREARQWWW
jgi:hypothetical protein